MKILKLLFICSTELQLFNALNLKLHLFPDDVSDIIIQFLKKDTVDFYNRIRESGLFENVCYRLPDVFGFHEYARYVRKGDFSKSLSDAAKNSARQLYTRIVSQKSKNFIDNVKEQIYNFDKLEFSSYQQIFAGGTNDIVVNILKYVRSCNPACKLNLYEEGVGSYVFSTLGLGSDLLMDAMYLYEPEMAIYEHPLFQRIPKVRKDDVVFINVVNRIFAYASGEQEIRNKIIFFDTDAKPMPAYLRCSAILSNTLFRVPYKKHLYENEMFMQQLRAYNLLADYAKDRGVIVKLHPRTERNDVQNEYGHDKTSIMESISIPWEVFCCNCSMENNIFVTLMSTAVTARTLIMEEENNNSVIILESYTEMGNRSYDLYRMFFQKLQKEKMQNQLYLPKSEQEYLNVLDKIL